MPPSEKSNLFQYLNLPCYCSKYQPKLQDKSYNDGKKIKIQDQRFSS